MRRVTASSLRDAGFDVLRDAGFAVLVSMFMSCGRDEASTRLTLHRFDVYNNSRRRNKLWICGFLRLREPL